MCIFGGGRRKRAFEHALDATAVIRKAEPIDPDLTGGAEPGESGILSHLPDQLGIGKRRYELTLEITPPDGSDPYEVDLDTKVPAKSQWAGGFRLRDLPPGLELPVKVDPIDRAKVEIDWPKFLDDPDRKKAVSKASSDHNIAVYREEVATTETGRRLIEGNRQALPVWVQAVKAGKMKRKQLDQTIELELRMGRMDPADAEAAYRELDG